MLDKRIYDAQGFASPSQVEEQAVLVLQRVEPPSNYFALAAEIFKLRWQACKGIKMEAITEYFNQTDTPSENSPTGATMGRILAKFPQMSFDDARIRANELLRRQVELRSIASLPF